MAHATVRHLAIALCALGCASGCRGDERKSGAERGSPTLTVERAPGRPLARKPPRPAPTDTAPASASRTAAQTSFERVTGDGYSGWLRPLTSSAHFRPTRADIAALEAALPASFAAAVDAGGLPPGLDVSTYERQYNGYRMGAGGSSGEGAREVIEVKLFCARSKEFARKILQIKGGGSCFLHTAYDLGTGRFRYWRQNPD